MHYSEHFLFPFKFQKGHYLLIVCFVVLLLLPRRDCVPPIPSFALSTATIEFCYCQCSYKESHLDTDSP